MASAKKLVVDLLCHPVVGSTLVRCWPGGVPSLRFPGPRVSTDVPSVPDRLAAAIFWGIYESAEIRFLRRYLRRDLDVVELGSSIGVVASQIARLQQPGHKLVCVEANPELVALLTRNLERNASEREFHVLNRAIDYDPSRSQVALVFGDTNLGGRTVGREAEGMRHRNVDTSTLSEILAQNGIDSFALVSDIEGAEVGILRHDRAALERCEQLCIELHDSPSSPPDETVAALRRRLAEEHGFRLVERHGDVAFFDRPAGRSGVAVAGGLG